MNIDHFQNKEFYFWKAELPNLELRICSGSYLLKWFVLRWQEEQTEAQHSCCSQGVTQCVQPADA